MSPPVLVNVQLTTLTGACYIFPDVQKIALDQMMDFMKNRADDDFQFMLINISNATLCIPWCKVRVVEEVGTEEETGAESAVPWRTLWTRSGA